MSLEPTISKYISRLVNTFDQVKRVLKQEGSCWVVMGDSYRRNKSLYLIPERFVTRMLDHGWLLRNKVIWHKPNAMPSPVKDRFTIDFETLFFFTKSQKYWFETQYEPCVENGYTVWPAFGGKKGSDGANATYSGEDRAVTGYGRIKRSVWRIPTQRYAGAHFAVFPEELVETPLKATCPVGGIVLDPFLGSGTTALVALNNARRFIGIELNPAYIKLAEERLKSWSGQQVLEQPRLAKAGTASRLDYRTESHPPM